MGVSGLALKSICPASWRVVGYVHHIDQSYGMAGKQKVIRLMVERRWMGTDVYVSLWYWGDCTDQSIHAEKDEQHMTTSPVAVVICHRIVHVPL